MKALRALVLSFCLLGLACGGSDDDGRVTVADVKDSASLKDFVEYAAERLEGSATFEEAMQLISEFREEGGDWNDGSTYLVLLSRSGGVYIHSKNRKLEDQDWSGLQDARGKNVGQLFLREEGGFVGYHDKDGSPRVSYAFPFRGPSIPLTHPENIDQQVFILLGGFNFEPETPEQSYFDLVMEADEKGLPIPEDLRVEAENVNDRDELRRFVDEAIYYFTAFMGSDEVDLVQLRRFFRVDRGPWRYVSTYIYIMDDRGNVIFNGGNRNIEQTNLSDHPEVGDTIREIICVAKQLGGGYVKYNWNDPNDPSDDPPDGGAGGDSPKLGYARGIPINKGAAEEDLIYYIFGSGVYLDADGVAETTRTYTPDNSACK